MKRLILPALIVALASAVLAQEIDYVETFTLAADRSEALRELVPGTDDYFYYHALHAQNEGRRDDFQTWMDQWIAEHNGHIVANARMLLNRQAMLDFDTDPDATCKYLTTQLKPHFYHTRKTTDSGPVAFFPIDLSRISDEAFLKAALSRRNHQSLVEIKPHALERAAGLVLNGEQRGSLIAMLTRPDFPKLVDHIIADLDFKTDRSFGYAGIHRLLTLDQLDELLQKRPGIRNEAMFVQTYLSKLVPPDEINLDLDADARKAYLDRVWTFVQTLDPAHNSLKANVLYSLLRHDQKAGIYNRDLFLAYIQLPRNVHYLAADMRKALPRGDHMAQLQASFDYIRLPPVRNEEPLVRDYLLHFFVEDNDCAGFAEWMRDDFLKPLLAEAKITAGIGDPKKWVALITPEQYRQIKERVDIDFAPTNPDVFAADAPVKLSVFVKNVPALMVKIFEINTLNYIRETGQPLNLAINLDGLTATVERRLAFKDTPELRVARELDFPELDARGTYVVELIGNGKSSRALVQKGRLDVLQALTAAGQAFTVLDENQNPLPDARAWLGGREFTANSDGNIVIPFTTRPQPETLVVWHGKVAAPVRFDHIVETYQLEANAYVDRESLLRREKAVLVLRPVLTVAGHPTSLEFLESPKLQLTLTDIHDIQTRQQVDLALADGDVVTHEFTVPDNAVSLSLTLSAKVQNLSQNRKDKLSADARFAFNESDTRPLVQDLHLGKTAKGYILELRGKNGEPRAGVSVSIWFTHRDFNNEISLALPTDQHGRIELGPLANIQRIRASDPAQTTRSWDLATDAVTLPPALHGNAGETLRLPLTAGLADTPAAYSLLERRNNLFIRDWNQALAARGGFLELRGLPAGEYSLYIKPLQQDIPVRVTQGREEPQFVLSPRRALERPRLQPLQITGVKVKKDAVEIQLANASPYSRVHVLATRYLPAFDLFAGLVSSSRDDLQQAAWTAARAFYESGRDIGDEYRYILDRQSAARFYGNMLERPGLLLNPWELRATDAARENLRGGGDYRGAVADTARSSLTRGMRRPPARAARSCPSNLDFLAQPAVARWNLVPDAAGKIRIPRAELANLPHLRVLAADPLSAVLKHIALDDSPAATRELRHAGNLDPHTPCAEQKIITPLHAGQSLEMDNIVTATINRCDTIEKAWQLLTTLLALENDDTGTVEALQDLAVWNTLTPEKRLRFYSDHASHEVNLFLYHKDPEFFQEVIHPYLQNKKDKTFVDLWLLESDLSAFLEPWRFARLNAAERALLSRRLPAQSASLARHARELADIIPPDPFEDNIRFDAAMLADSLSATDSTILLMEEATLAGLEVTSDAVSPLILKDLSASGMAEHPHEMGRATSIRRAPSASMGVVPKAGEIMYDELTMGDLSAVPDIQEFSAAPYDAFDIRHRQEAVTRFFQKLDKTKEWAENNYYHLPIEAQTADLVPPGPFWADAAAHVPGTPFLSEHLLTAAHTSTEVILALALLDLPFEAPEHSEQWDGQRYTLTAARPTIVFHREIRKAGREDDSGAILIAQHFFRADDRYRFVDGVRLDKTVEDEFLPHVVYGAEVVLTNPQGNSQPAVALLQIPDGALPVQSGFYTKGQYIHLDSHETQTIEYYFYFPETGTYAHYPATLALNDQVIAGAKPFTFHVVPRLTDIDRESWAWLAHNGTTRDVVAYLANNNIARIQPQLSEIAWRMRERKVFQQITALLDEHHIYDQTLWSYGLYHKDPATLRAWLEHSGFAENCGLYLDSPLLSLNPVERLTYQHLEYSPLVNPRAHPVGGKPKIHNTSFRRQYETLMKVLSQKPALSAVDRLAVAQAMLMQDRVAEAADWFARVDRAQIPEQMQYDYIAVYLAFYRGDTAAAREIAAPYAGHPVHRWRVRFEQALAQLDEIERGIAAAAPVDPESREHSHDAIAAAEPALELLVEAGVIRLDTRNLETVTLNFYPMDIELLFSRNPFLSDDAAQFAFVRPALTQTVNLAGKTAPHTLELPKQFRAKNVMVEALGAGLRQTQGYYANTLKVQVVETYGQVAVTHSGTQKPVAGAYVKVYARMNNGRIEFLKDGYTDLRGRFDYASLNTNELDHANRLAILILADDLGALVREAKPPKQ